jgi:hypothetical protein
MEASGRDDGHTSFSYRKYSPNDSQNLWASLRSALRSSVRLRAHGSARLGPIDKARLRLDNRSFSLFIKERNPCLPY